MPQPTPRTRPAVALAAALLLSLAACGGKTDAELIASAKAYLAKNDLKAATIDLKSALQKNPRSAEARYLLGKALLDGGDVQGALVELGKARDEHYSKDFLMPTLAKAELAAGQVKRVTDEFASTQLNDSKAAADLKASLGVAYFYQGDIQRSRASIDQALQLDPKNSTARLQQARLAARNGEFDAALSIVDGVIADDPKLIDARMLKGELLWGGKKDVDGAIRVLNEALAIDPKQPTVHEALIRMDEEKGDLAAEKFQIEQLLKDVPGSVQALFFGTRLALLNGDTAKARDGAQQLLRIAPNSARVLQLAGSAELASGAIGQALVHLNQAVQIAPHVPGSRILLAMANLRAAQPGDALEALKPLMAAPNPSAQVFDLAAQAHLQTGDVDGAVAYFKRAVSVDPHDAGARVALALTDVVRGDAQAGFAALKAIAASEKDTMADYALVRAYLLKADLAGALQAVDHVLVKTPKEPLPYLMRGRILLLQHDGAKARASFERALSIDPDYFAAVAELAAQDVAANHLGQAQQRYQAFLKRRPGDYHALLALADIEQRTGAKPEAVEALLVSAVKAHPDEPAPRLALIQHRLGQRHATAALEAAQDAVATIPGNPQLQDALGTAQLAAGDAQQAVATFRKIATSQSASPQPYLRLAQVYAGQRDYPAAVQSLNKALEIAPGLLAAQSALIEVALARDRVADAVAVARQVQKQRPREATGYLMEGGVYASRKDWTPAIAALRTAFERQPSTAVAIRLHGVYVAAGRAADAEAFAGQWRKQHPKDLDFIFHLGSMALDLKQYAQAEALYREVLAAQPDNAVALNNVAWLMVMQNKPGAVAMAQRALQLAPGEPAFMDTMSRALEADKQPTPALDWARKAVVRAPDKPDYRLHLAKLLIAGGDRDQARTELQRLAALGGRFDRQPEVASLLAGL